MIDLLIERAERDPHAPFLLHDATRFDFASVCDQAARGADWLAAQGVAPGDRVVLAVPNRPLFLLYWFAILWRGAVAVPVAHDAFGDALRYVATQSGASCVLTDEGDEARRVCEDLAPIGVRVVSLADEAAFARAVNGHERQAPPATEAAATLAILYTSGTTGLPKGVMVSAQSYRAIGRRIVEAIGITAADRILTFLPLHHANPQMYSVMSALTVGCAIAIAPRFSASRFLGQVAQYQATGFTYVGTVLAILAKELSQPAAGTLRFCVGGGAPKAVWERVGTLLGVHIHELYGMTETGGMVTINSREHYRLGSVGKVRDDVELALLDDDDRPVTSGVGEIAVRPRAPHVLTSGYFGKPEETVAASRNWWFHTGDLGRLDADGFLYFEGRKKELIRRAGEMIAPATIELAALQNDAIADCAAVGVPDDILGEEIKLCVVPRHELSARDIHGFLAARLARHMLPRFVQFVDAIPKTPTQKIQRFRLLQVRGTIHDLRAS
jgi:crotonobetaine/carnitine-CoA ligase